MIRLFYIIIFLMVPTAIFAQDSMKETDQLDFAQGLLSRGMYDMAILQYQKFIADYPHSNSLQEAYLSLGEGYFLSQDFKNAVDTFNQFNQLFPNSGHLPVSVLRLGQIDIQQKDYDAAIKELGSIDAQKSLKGPMLQSFDYYLAESYLGKSDLSSAITFFQKATQVDGAGEYTAFAFKELGKIYCLNKQYDLGLNAYAKAMLAAGDDTLKGEIAYRSAEVGFLSGNYAQAIKDFEQVISQYPDSEYTHDAVANILLAYFNLGQYDQLLVEYQKDAKQVKDDGTYFSIHFSAVMAYIELTEYDQANALLDRMLAFADLKSQERARIFIEKANILIKEKKFKDGLALLEAYSSEDADNTDETLFLKAQAYFGVGDFDRAFNFFENVYLNFPDSRYSKAALLGQAHARQEMGRLQESEALFLKYYQTQDQPDLKSESLYDAVLMAVKAQDIDGAISNAQEYLKTFPKGDKYGEVLLILADNFDDKNQPQQAVDLMQEYLAQNPSPQKPNSLFFLLGFNEQILGHSDQALADYAKVDPQKEEGKFYSGALKNMAIIFLDQKNETQAKVYFDRLISLTDQNGLNVKTYIWVCNEYLKEQKFNDVLRVAGQAQKHFLSKDLLEITYFRAEALRGLGSCDQAIQDYEVVSSSDEKNMFTGSAHIGHGLCLEKAQKFDEAKKEFQKSLDENADDNTVTVHARFETANIDAAQGNTDEALKLYMLVATIYDDDYYCSESLLRAARIFEALKRKDDALKLYSEILDKYKNSTAAVEAKARFGGIK